MRNKNSLKSTAFTKYSTLSQSNSTPEKNVCEQEKKTLIDTCVTNPALLVSPLNIHTLVWKC